jgi:hypothetical protein
MAQITNDLPWKKIPTKILVNDETGQAEVFAKEGIFGDTKIAEVGANNEWTVTNISALTKKYNNLNGTKLTEAQVQDIFDVEGVKTFNNERAAIINANSPFNTKVFLATKQNPVPGVKDPNTNALPTQTAPTVATTQPEPVTGSNPQNGPASTPTNGDPNTNGTNTDIGSRKNNYPDSLLVYPVKRKNANGGDFIKFEILNYQKSGLTNLSTIVNGSVALPGMEYRDPGKPLATIYLPIQSGIVEGMSVDWGGGELNPITAAFASAAYSTINAAGSADLGKFFGGVATGAETIKDLFNNASPELRQLAINYFTEQSVKTNGLLSRTLGGAINNNLELLFNGPMLRSFTFNFKLTPREPNEAVVIKKMIRYFKKSMAPALSTAQLFLLAPNVFKISYVYTGKGNLNEDHPYLNRIKVAALRDISVNYTPDGNYMTYQDGSMTQYELNLTFGEIDPIYENDYELNEGKIGTGW